MPTELLAAAALIRAVADTPADDLALRLAALPKDDPFLQAADFLARAANSDDAEERSAGLQALFGGVVEHLCDRFSPAGRLVYSRAFSRVIQACRPASPAFGAALSAAGLADDAAIYRRHQAARQRPAPFPAPEPVQHIAVLSRVTLGADVLLTSVLLQHLQARWPQAQITLIGDAKLHGLLGGLPGLQIAPLAYQRRGALHERLASFVDLRQLLQELQPDLLVSPDSRLDQLGLLPLLPLERSLHWENLLPETAPAESLATGLDHFCQAQLGTQNSFTPRLCPPTAVISLQEHVASALGARPILAVKLDHGGNPAKSLPRATELLLLAGARQRGWRILLDRGFGPAELAGSDQLMQELQWTPRDLQDTGDSDQGLALAGLEADCLANASVIRFTGSISGWAALLSKCQAAFSYDSVGHHLAAACGVPLVVAFTGHPDARFPVAWQPRGPGQIKLLIIAADEKQDPAWAGRLLDALPLLA